MAVQPRVTRLRLQDTATGTTNVLEWIATAAVQDTPAGASVTVTIVRTVVGVPPGDPNTLNIRPLLDTGVGLVAGTALNPTAASQTFTFHFTSDGTATGAARAGTIEFALRAARTDVGTYDVRTDGNPNTPPAGFSSVLDRGWVRGTTTANQALSNLSLGGAKAAPAEYDESLFVRTTLGATLYVARALTVGITGATPALSAATNSATAGNFDASFTAVVDERFPAAVTPASTTLTIPNATLTGQPDFTVANTADSLDVDSRIPASLHLWQMDDDQMGTPPMSKHEASKSALVSSYSGLAMRLVRARTGTGVNGLSTTITLDPRAAGSAVTRSSVTATRGGEAGWTELAQLGPFVTGGAWDATLVITAPADIDGAGYVVSNTEVVTILAPDPRIQLRGYVNKRSDQKDHFTEGEAVVVNMSAVDLTTFVRIDPARVTEPKVAVIRYRASDDRLEYLNADGTSWSVWEPTAPAPALAMAASANDPRNYIRDFPTTAGWGRDLMAVLFSCKVDGTPYSGFTAREETGDANTHSGFSLDPIGLALAGVLSTR